LEAKVEAQTMEKEEEQGASHREKYSGTTQVYQGKEE
jgi:hypothetical protein